MITGLREGERKVTVREPWVGCCPYAPRLGSNPQLFWCTDRTAPTSPAGALVPVSQRSESRLRLIRPAGVPSWKGQKRARIGLSHTLDSGRLSGACASPPKGRCRICALCSQHAGRRWALLLARTSEPEPFSRWTETSAGPDRGPGGRSPGIQPFWSFTAVFLPPARPQWAGPR